VPERSLDSINPDVRNPLCEFAMTLRDVREQARFVTVFLNGPRISYVSLTTSWTMTISEDRHWWEQNTRLEASGIVLPGLIERPSPSRDRISLEERGIYPYENGTWNDAFSVLATEENLEKLDQWLKERRGIGVASVLRSTPDLWECAFTVRRVIPREHRRRLAELITPYV
jgi:hypothetical protein